MTGAQHIVDTPQLEFAVWWGLAAGPLAAASMEGAQSW